MNMSKASIKMEIQELKRMIPQRYAHISEGEQRIVQLQKVLDDMNKKTGRVMSIDDLFADEDVQECWIVGTLAPTSKKCYCNKEVTQEIKMGVLFYDKASCEVYISRLVREQRNRLERMS